MSRSADHEPGEDVSGLLFGADGRPGVTGLLPDAEPAARTARAHVWRRVNGQVVRDVVEWEPWFLSREPFAASGRRTRLEGEGYCWLHRFATVEDYRANRDALRGSAPGQPPDILALGSLERQFLVQTGITFFKGMVFEDVHRMQLDIETTSLSPNHNSARVLLAGVKDNRGFEEAVWGTEEAILARLTEIIRTVDPDVLEGHNIVGFDLPYLMGRAEALGQELRWGRNGGAVRPGMHRSLPFGGMARPFTAVHIPGRSVIDTFFGCQRYDVGRSELVSLGLKSVARQLGIAAPERIELDRTRMEELCRENPDEVRRYCLQDVWETGELARIVMPPDFYVSQMAPDTYQGNATGGTGEKINLLLMREYLRQGRAIPVPQMARPFAGGYTELRTSGVVERVVKCDVESLYPSLMLACGIHPASDTLGVFLPMLRDLTARRLDAKARRKSSTGVERAYWDGLQASFKILINSFFGYLGASFHFNDLAAAERVTSGGQEVVRQIVHELEQTGAMVIEVDTDGVYFQPPAGVDGQAAEEEMIAAISTRLPQGIHLAHDGRWRMMLSLKVKNYVLVGYDGAKTCRGAALRSRADEPFGQDFLTRAVDLIADGHTVRVAELYADFIRRIDQGEMKVADFARRERITEKSLEGKSLQRAGHALNGARPGDFVRLYRRRDGTLARAEDYSGDEDREFLKDKLYKFALRLEPVIGPAIQHLCPRPGHRLDQKIAGQQSLDLFDG